MRKEPLSRIWRRVSCDAKSRRAAQEINKPRLSLSRARAAESSARLPKSRDGAAAATEMNAPGDAGAYQDGDAGEALAGSYTWKAPRTRRPLDIQTCTADAPDECVSASWGVGDDRLNGSIARCPERIGVKA